MPALHRPRLFDHEDFAETTFNVPRSVESVYHAAWDSPPCGDRPWADPGASSPVGFSLEPGWDRVEEAVTGSI